MKVIASLLISLLLENAFASFDSPSTTLSKRRESRNLETLPLSKYFMVVSDVEYEDDTEFKRLCGQVQDDGGTKMKPCNAAVNRQFFYATEDGLIKPLVDDTGGKLCLHLQKDGKVVFSKKCNQYFGYNGSVIYQLGVEEPLVMTLSRRDTNIVFRSYKDNIDQSWNLLFNVIAKTGNPCTEWSNLDHQVGCPMCFGDCDSDDECTDGLRCGKRRSKYDSPVPGCFFEFDGSINDKKTEMERSNDFCFSPVLDNGNEISYVGECGYEDYQCGLCQGDCDFDSDCEEGLICYERDGIEPVPGCVEEGSWKDLNAKDICTYPLTE